MPLGRRLGVLLPLLPFYCLKLLPVFLLFPKLLHFSAKHFLSTQAAPNPLL